MSKFNFRNFSIDQSNSPLKVGTDAILLGACIEIAEDTISILDVGTGTGVVAMILASRFKNVHVSAVEPNEQAFFMASQNFKNAPFAERLTLFSTSIEAFESNILFDVVVSNPPYFIDGLKSLNPDMKQAKHLYEHAFFAFIDASLSYLKDSGLFWLILPKPLAETVSKYLCSKGLKQVHKTRFHSNLQKLDIRWVLAFSKNENKPNENDDSLNCHELFIRNTDGSFHQDYINLAGYLHAKNL